MTVIKSHKVMNNRKIKNTIEFVVSCVGAFAERFNLSNVQSYSYLHRFGGIDFLFDFYDAEHTLSIEDAVMDLQMLCAREGGKLA